jgi:hypothetical protein
MDKYFRHLGITQKFTAKDIETIKKANEQQIKRDRALGIVRK